MKTVSMTLALFLLLGVSQSTAQSKDETISYIRKHVAKCSHEISGNTRQVRSHSFSVDSDGHLIATSSFQEFKGTKLTEERVWHYRYDPIDVTMQLHPTGITIDCKLNNKCIYGTVNEFDIRGYKEHRSTGTYRYATGSLVQYCDTVTQRRLARAFEHLHKLVKEEDLFYDGDSSQN